MSLIPSQPWLPARDITTTLLSSAGSPRGLPIPELPHAQTNGDWAAQEGNIRILEEDPLCWPQLAPGAHDTPFLEMARGDLRLTVEGIGYFRIHNGEQIAWQRARENVSDQDLRTFLLGSAVGALLIQRGILVLHGNALERDGQAIVCLGHSGAGKSTLAYALMRQGWRLLADDLVAITPDGQVLPGIPRIKLWHDAVKAFGLDPNALPPIRQGMQKYLLLGEAIERAERPCPLKALYLIRQQRRDIDDPDDSRIARINRQQQATPACAIKPSGPDLYAALLRKVPTSSLWHGCSRRCPSPAFQCHRGYPRCRTGCSRRRCSLPRQKPPSSEGQAT